MPQSAQIPSSSRGLSAGETGHQEAERPLQETLREEEAMAHWIDSHLSDVTHTYLERYVADQKAGL